MSLDEYDISSGELVRNMTLVGSDSSQMSSNLMAITTDAVIFVTKDNRYSFIS